MRIEYDITVDDLEAFNLYHIRHSPEARKQFYIAWFGVPALTLVAIAVALALGDAWLAVVMGVFAIIFTLFVPRLYYQSARRTIRRMLREGSQARVGQHVLHLGAEGITERTGAGETTVKWAAVDRVALDTDHAYIYFDAVQAFVLPRRAFPEAAGFDAFIASVRERLPST